VGGGEARLTVAGTGNRKAGRGPDPGLKRSGEAGTGSNRRLERNGGESVTRLAKPGT
jgi:hypothetical protein